MRFATLALIFFFYSAIGWTLEVLYAFFIHRCFVNRGFLNGPLCPMYGVSGIAVTFVLQPLSAYPALVFSIGALLISAVEFVTGVLMERLFSARWWNYSDHKFNLLGYVSLSFTLLWGGLSLALLYFINPLLTRFVALFPAELIFWVAVGFSVLLIADLSVTVWSALALRGTVRDIQDFLASLPEKLDETIHRLQNGRIYLSTKGDPGEWSRKFRFFQRRLMSSFPEMHYRNFKEGFELLRSATKKRIGRKSD